MLLLSQSIRRKMNKGTVCSSLESCSWQGECWLVTCPHESTIVDAKWCWDGLRYLFNQPLRGRKWPKVTTLLLQSRQLFSLPSFWLHNVHCLFLCASLYCLNAYSLFSFGAAASKKSGNGFWLLWTTGYYVFWGTLIRRIKNLILFYHDLLIFFFLLTFPSCFLESGYTYLCSGLITDFCAQR